MNKVLKWSIVAFVLVLVIVGATLIGYYNTYVTVSFEAGEYRYYDTPRSFVYRDYNISPVSVKRGTKYSVSIPSRPYCGFRAPVEYEFCGWYKDSALTVPWINGEDRVMTNITLYAKWKIILV
jgi:uncharacterized repeat protein (TIGR02543 family)